MDIGGELPPSRSFPALIAGNHRITSDRSESYNCLAWAAGDDTRWWWPDDEDNLGLSHWPEGVPRSEDLEAFVAAFETLGYGPCEDGRLETGLEKVAIYSRDGVPTHAARQLPEGTWTSKLGQGFDIRHALKAIEGPAYGLASLFLARPIGRLTR
jgi:hypothetical protein